MRVAIAPLKFIPENVVSSMLSSFTEARSDVRTIEGASSLARAAMTAVLDKQKNSVHEEIPAIVFTKTPFLTDRLLAFIAALALSVDNCQCDLQLLAIDTRLTLVRLSHSFRELGCTVKPVRLETDGKSRVESYIAELKVPLTFPPPKLSRGPSRG